MDNPNPIVAGGRCRPVGGLRASEHLIRGVDRDGLSEAERQRRFRAEMNVLLPSKVGNSSSRSSTKRPTNKRALSATRNRADERTAASATCDPGPIAFLVIAALPL